MSYSVNLSFSNAKEAKSFIALICETIPQYGEEIMDKVSFSFPYRNDRSREFSASTAWEFCVGTYQGSMDPIEWEEVVGQK
tara:strand:+ start:226 stop:468 length:243 start_codon:yes stop_codon:yes gene_type:complete